MMRTLATVALSSLLGGVIAVGVSHRLAAPDPAPTPAPVPVAPISIIVGKPGPIRLSMGGPIDSVAWKVIGRDFAESPVQPDGAAAEVASDPASRLALASYLAGGRPGLATATIPGTTTPPPDPTPGPLPTPVPPKPDPPKPDPQPAPGPVLTGPFWAVAVFDFGGLASLPAGQQAIFKDLHLRPSVNGMGGEFLKLDIRDPVEQAKRSMVAVKASGKLPALVLVREDGSVHGDVLDLPLDPQGVIDAIKTARGKR